MEITLTQDNFKSEVLQATVPVLVDFWAPWCGPCKMQNPILDELVSKLKDRIKVAKVNVDENQEIAGQYGVMSIPTLVWFSQGKIVGHMIGLQSLERLEAEAERLLA